MKLSAVKTKKLEWFSNHEFMKELLKLPLHTKHSTFELMGA